jgi:hypothetical protein
MTKLLVLLAAAVVGGALAPSASACSCIAPGKPRADLARADGAIVGVYLGRSRLSANAYLYTFRVERQVKGRFPVRLKVLSGSNSADCGLQVRRRQRIALLLHRVERRWHSSLCDQRAPTFFRGVGSRALAGCG